VVKVFGVLVTLAYIIFQLTYHITLVRNEPIARDQDSFTAYWKFHMMGLYTAITKIQEMGFVILMFASGILACISMVYILWVLRMRAVQDQDIKIEHNTVSMCSFLMLLLVLPLVQDVLFGMTQETYYDQILMEFFVQMMICYVCNKLAV